MRILNSLPRTHKLLLLPVATMVTVLGAHKILTSVEDARQGGQDQDSVLIALGEDASPGVPSLALDRAPVSEAIQLASRAKDATLEAIPLSQLPASEIVDVNFARAAQNIDGLDVLPSMGANVYDILRRDKLVLTKAAVEALEARLK